MVALRELYELLYVYFGHQAWWPAEDDFEVAVGAILTQRSSWRNAERNIENLRGSGALDCVRILSLPEDSLQRLLRPSGFYRQKSEYIRGFCEALRRDFGGDIRGLRRVPKEDARRWLLSIRGIGPETADSILLYACDHLQFVIDAYTSRILTRVEGEEVGSYEELQARFEREMPRDIETYQQYHALLVELGKRFCSSRPKCFDCPINRMCRTADNTCAALKKRGGSSDFTWTAVSIIDGPRSDRFERFLVGAPQSGRTRWC